MSDHSTSSGVSEAARAAGHEVTDAHAGPLARAGIALAVTILVGFIGMLVMFRTLAYVQPLYDSEAEAHPLSESRSLHTGPRLQLDPPRQKVELREFEDKQLTGYDWVDEDARVARIPIDRAIEILATTGLPQKAGSGAAATD